MSTAFPAPRGGASLILSFRLERRITLIIGGNPLAASRAFSALEADSQVVILSKGLPCEELQWRASQDQLLLYDLNSLAGGQRGDAEALDAYLSASEPVSLVCVTDTLSSSSDRRTKASAAEIYRVCRKHHIPTNTTDYPEFCDFSFTSTHRFLHFETGEATSLQVGITTNGQGCRLSGRIKREVVSRLPKEVGAATAGVGRLRSRGKLTGAEEEGREESVEEPTPNTPVPQRTSPEGDFTETASEATRRRMKWVAQVSEYWPLSKLATMTSEDIESILPTEPWLEFSNKGSFVPKSHLAESEIPSIHELSLSPPRCGRILLVGSGPGHPSLLTIAAHNALTKHADFVLSDKLVPAEVLALIPSTVEVQIARKFPGNAEGAQKEMQEAAVEAAKRGLTVVRLKQGDPTIYGRAGEEVLYFRSHGFEPIVVPGVTSALAGPIFAGIPVTQRGAAESFVVCTGVGRGGKEVKLPGYDRGRTLVILMGVARLTAVLDTLQIPDLSLSRRVGPAYPPHVPIAVIERASMSDQRVVSSTLQNISNVFDSMGEQRPPGMIVVGWSVLSLWDKGDMNILDDGAEAYDEQRIQEWLGDQPWRMQDGLDNRWADL